MKKIIATLLTVGFMLIGTSNVQANPPRPAGVHPQAKYLDYKGMDCWRYWKVLKCVPRS